MVIVVGARGGRGSEKNRAKPHHQGGGVLIGVFIAVAVIGH